MLLLLSSYPDHRALHSFPTRRSSDLFHTRLPWDIPVTGSARNAGQKASRSGDPIRSPLARGGGTDDAAAPRGTGACSAALVRRAGRVGPSRGAGYGSRRLRHAEARRHRRALRDRAARDPDPTARRAGDPAARPRHLPIADAAPQDEAGRDRGGGATPRRAEPDARDGDVLRHHAAGALQPGGRERHEPGPAVPTGRDRAVVAAVELLPARSPRAGGGDLPLRGGNQLPGGAHRDLPGAVQRLVDGGPAGARPRAGAGAGAGAARATVITCSAPSGSLPDTSIPVEKASAATAMRATTVA